MKKSLQNESGGGELKMLFLFGLVLYVGIFLLLVSPREYGDTTNAQSRKQPARFVQQMYAFTRLVAYLGGEGK